MKSKKVQLVAKIMNNLGINNIGLLINRIIHGKNHIRAVNYHSTPEEYMGQFEKQMQYYSKHYTPVSKEDLKDLLNGVWKKDKPGLIISFDDGLESNYEYAKPIIEKYNFIGWFFVPVGLINKGEWKKKDNTGKSTEKYMNWGQVRELSKNHVIGSHTLTHRRLKQDLSNEILREEILGSKIILEEYLQDKVDIFCWVGGERFSYSKEASDIIKASGYKYSFLTNHYPIKKGANPLQLERTNIEADWPIYLIKFYTSFFMDLRYRKKRNEIKKLIE